MRAGITILLFFIFLSSPARGQGVALPSTVEKAKKAFFFSNYTTRDGLPHGLVNLIFEDSRGFLWISCQTGLTRYDGFEFKPILGEGSANDHSISILSMAEDSTHQVWASSNGLLLRLDGLSDEAVLFPCDSLGADIYIVMAGRKTLLLSTDIGMVWYYIKENKFIKAVLKKPVPGNEAAKAWGIPNTNQFIGQNGQFSYDGKGGFWVAGKNDKSSGLYYWEMSLNRWHYYPYSKNDNPAQQNLENLIDCLMLDTDGCVYCGGWGGGLRRYNTHTRRWESLGMYLEKSRLQYNAIHFIYPRNSHELWLGTELGIIAFDKTTLKGEVWENDKSDPNTILQNRKICCCVRRNGAVWFGGSGGVSCIDPALQSFPQTQQIPADEDCYAVYKDTTNGRTFWATNHSIHPQLALYCAEAGQQQHMIFRRSDSAAFVFNSMLRDPFEHFYWVITDEGLYQLDAGNFKLSERHDKIYENNSGTAPAKLPLKNLVENGRLLTLKDIPFRCAIADHKGDVWFGAYNYGVIRYHRPSKTYLRWNLRRTISIQQNMVRSLFCDHAGRIWAGLLIHSGLAVYDPVQNRDLRVDTTAVWSKLFSTEAVYGFAEDQSGNVWVASTNGLIRCRLSDKGVLSAARVPEIGMAVYFVALDEAGKLWMKTNSGVRCFDPSSGQVNIFNEKTGMSADFTYGRMFKTDDGEFFYGEKYRWRPKDITPEETSIPQVTITSVHLFEKPIPAEKWSVPGIVLPLDYDENALYFDFSALNMNQPRDCRYHWQLIGSTPLHTSTGAWGEHRATFTNLPPGEYRFEVWADKDRSGAVSEKNVTTIRFRISPPIWQTWWFRSLIAGCLGGLIYFYYKNRLAIATAAAKMNQQQAEIGQKEAEFQRSLSEMEISALRAQMNPHFIFNSLSTLESFIMEHQTEEATQQLHKFSRLTRLVLENSARPLVPLEDDLSALRLYVELEQIRFQNAFSVQWFVDADVLDENPQVPPLLVQPFVENAILHGLRNKKTGEKWLHIRLRREGEMLVFSIEDNGVGREQTRALASHKTGGQTSLGGKLTERRIQLFNQTSRNTATVQVQDLYHDRPDTGTRVELRLPLG